MSEKRTAESGEPVNEPSHRVDLDEEAQGWDGTKEPHTRLAGPIRSPLNTGTSTTNAADSASGRRSSSKNVSTPSEAQTRVIRAKSRGTHENDEQIRLLRPSRGEKPTDNDDPMADPIAGWLVVIAGPGKGEVCRLGYGSNTVGRGRGSRVCLDFGDNQISRDGHAIVTYDPKGRKFYLHHGGGKNLTYLHDEPILFPVAIKAMDEFSLGRTTLRFVPFCGPEFDWQDTLDR